MSGIDGWADSTYALVSADGWGDMASSSASDGCCETGSTTCPQRSMDSGRCGGEWSRMVRERLFDFFNGTHGVDVAFTHPVRPVRATHKHAAGRPRHGPTLTLPRSSRLPVDR